MNLFVSDMAGISVLHFQAKSYQPEVIIVLTHVLLMHIQRRLNDEVRKVA